MPASRGHRGGRLFHRRGLDAKVFDEILVLFLIDVSSRRVEIAGLARQANGLWMSQVARNLSDAAEGFHGRQTILDP